MPRVSTIDRAIPGTLVAPETWTAWHVRNRLVEACQIEKRVPDNRPRRHGGAWFPVLYEFSDVVGWEDARERVWDRWQRSHGAMPFELTRMDEAFGWVRNLAREQPGEARCLSCWAVAMSHGISLQRLLKKRAWSSSTFHRKVASGSDRIARGLEMQRVPVR